MKMKDLKIPQYKIFQDLDGCLSAFEKGVIKLINEPLDHEKYKTDPKYRKAMWKALDQYTKDGGEFWYELELLDDALELWEYIKPYNPEILSATGVQHKENTANQKRKWVKKHLGDVTIHVVDSAAHKHQFAKENHILIDDQMRAIEPWENAGGIGILHTSTKNTIRKLKKILG